MDQFRRARLAVTKAGQVKGTGGRHEKDDRRRIDDRSTYVLGWSNQQKIDSLLYHDFLASYDFAKTGTKISGGITNITDEEPPFIEIGFNATTDPATYRMFGRGYYLRISQSFK